MSVGYTDDSAVAMYDTTSGVAFGPVFDSSEDVDDFLTWLYEQEQLGADFPLGHDRVMFKSDPRIYRPVELEKLVVLWRDKSESRRYY